MEINFISIDEAMAWQLDTQPISHVKKSGTARSKGGFEKDRGIVVHAIFGSEPNGFWGGKSLCRSEPGKGSNGWFLTSSEINCEKCLKKLLTNQHSNPVVSSV